MIFFKPENRDTKLLKYDIFKALLCPRPIGWISTINSLGDVNLAPYSFFSGALSQPNILSFSSETEKDTLVYAAETREFTWNLVTWDLKEKMNLSSAGLKRGSSEFEYAGIDMAPSNIVRAPRVSETPASLECRVTQIVKLKDLNGKPTAGSVVFGQVVGVHVEEKFIREGRIDTGAKKPIASCGYNDYTMVEKLFSMDRPANAGSTLGKQ